MLVCSEELGRELAWLSASYLSILTCQTYTFTIHMCTFGKACQDWWPEWIRCCHEVEAALVPMLQGLVTENIAAFQRYVTLGLMSELPLYLYKPLKRQITSSAISVAATCGSGPSYRVRRRRGSLTL